MLANSSTSTANLQTLHLLKLQAEHALQLLITFICCSMAKQRYLDTLAISFLGEDAQSMNGKWRWWPTMLETVPLSQSYWFETNLAIPETYNYTNISWMMIFWVEARTVHVHTHVYKVRKQSKLSFGTTHFLLLLCVMSVSPLGLRSVCEQTLLWGCTLWYSIKEYAKYRLN